MTDTGDHMAAVYHRMLMERSPQERFRMGLEMCAAARAAVLASLPPDLSPANHRIALLRRYYSNDFAPDALRRIEQALRARWTDPTPPSP